jgi:hypothetical protein
MQVSSTSPFTGNAATNASSNAAGNSGSPSSFQSLLSELTDYENETPAQRMEASILAQLGITPQQLASMSPADRAKMETEVKEIMKKEMQAQEQQQQQQQQAQAQTQQQVQAVQAQLQLPTSQVNTQSSTQSSSKHDTTITL